MADSVGRVIERLRAVRAVDFEWRRGPDGRPELVEVEVAPTLFEVDGNVVLSAEDGLPFADYYHDMHVNPELERIAREEGCFWEWESPGSLVLCEE